MGNMKLLGMQCSLIGPLRVARRKSHCFSRVVTGTWAIFSNCGGDGQSKLMSVQRHQDSCLVRRDNSGISTRLGRAIRTLVEVRQETQCTFLVATMMLGFRSIVNKSQAFKALNSACLSRFQSDVRPTVQMRWGATAFSRVSTVYSDIASSCEMNDETAFKPLQGNPAFV